MSALSFSALVILASINVDGATEAVAPRPLAHGHNCLDEPFCKTTLTQAVLSMINPTGPEHHLFLNQCFPLFTSPGMLFDYSNIEIGLFNIFAPVYMHQGAFASITPLSFVVLSASVAGVLYWPFPSFAGTGHYPRSGYQADFSKQSLPADEGTFAYGMEVNLAATLQGQVPLGPGKITFVNTLSAEYWSFGDSPYYFNIRRDMVLRQRDWIIMNSAMLFYQFPLSSTIELRLGVADDLSHVAAADYLAHRTALLLSADIDWDEGLVRHIQPFLTAGMYSHHAIRQGQAVLVVGVSATYDLSHDSSPP